MVGAMLAEMSAGNEGSVFFDPAQRAAVLRGLFDSYYHDIHPARTVFDTSRGWTGRLDLLARLFPDARVICCVRPIPWIIDSVERLIRRNPFELSKIFGFEQGGHGIFPRRRFDEPGRHDRFLAERTEAGNATAITVGDCFCCRTTRS